MAYVAEPISVARREREEAALRVAGELCRRSAQHLAAAQRQPDASRPCFLRSVYTVTDERRVTTELVREALTPFHEVGELLARCLRARVASSEAAAPSPPLACWLTLTLSDGCVLQHAFFGLAPAAAAAPPGPLRFTATLSAAPGPHGSAKEGPPPAHQEERTDRGQQQQQQRRGVVDSTPGAASARGREQPQSAETTGLGGDGPRDRGVCGAGPAAPPLSPPRHPSASPSPSSPGEARRRPRRDGGHPTTRAPLASPSPHSHQPSSRAPRPSGSPYREELWRIGAASMTTYRG